MGFLEFEVSGEVLGRGKVQGLGLLSQKAKTVWLGVWLCVCVFLYTYIKVGRFATACGVGFRMFGLSL